MNTCINCIFITSLTLVNSLVLKTPFFSLFLKKKRQRMQKRLLTTALSPLAETLTSTTLCCFMYSLMFRSDQISHSVVSDYLLPHESQHARPPCPSPTPGVHSDSRPLSQRCHPAISSSVIPFSSCPQSLPASESFPMSQLFA